MSGGRRKTRVSKPFRWWWWAKMTTINLFSTRWNNITLWRKRHQDKVAIFWRDVTTHLNLFHYPHDDETDIYSYTISIPPPGWNVQCNNTCGEFERPRNVVVVVVVVVVEHVSWLWLYLHSHSCDGGQPRPRAGGPSCWPAGGPKNGREEDDHTKKYQNTKHILLFCHQ